MCQLYFNIKHFKCVIELYQQNIIHQGCWFLKGRAERANEKVRWDTFQASQKNKNELGRKVILAHFFRSGCYYHHHDDSFPNIKGIGRSETSYLSVIPGVKLEHELGTLSLKTSGSDKLVER